jgi:hypothetical protein
MTSGHAKESTFQRLKGLPRLFRKPDGERLRHAAQRYPITVQRRLAALWDTNPF